MKTGRNKSIAVMLTAVLIIMLLLSGCSEEALDARKTQDDIQSAQTTALSTVDLSLDYDAADLNTDYSAAARIILADNSISSEAQKAVINQNSVTITGGGDYIISGSLSDGRITVNSADKTAVHLIFDGVSLSCSSSAPISVEQAQKTVITLKEGTENVISDNRSAAPEQTDEDGTADDTVPTAAVYSRDDLTFNGNGRLTVTGGYKNGIQSKDGLKLAGGNINVTAQNDAIKGKDFVAIKGGAYTLNAKSGDGIQSSNTDSAQVGFILIENGDIEITAGSDGITAAAALNISGGTMNITTVGEVAASAQNDQFGGMRGGKGFFGQNAPAPSEQQQSDIAGDTVSSKGIKSDGDMLISGGSVSISSTGHAVHSTKSVTVTGGEFEINSSKGKGFSAHSNLTITNGDINITKSTEGIESKAALSIDGGKIYIVSSDDGLNAGGDIGGVAQNSSASSEHKITINGGYIYIDAEGDGIDSNGSLTVNGGTVIVNGPQSSGNGALDGDGEILINGGMLVASGSAGMLEAPSSSSKQSCIIFGASMNADSTVCFKSSDGKELLVFSPSKLSGSIIFSSPELKSGESYSIYTGGSYSGGSQTDGVYSSGSYVGGSVAQSVTLSGVVNSAGINASQGAGGKGGGKVPSGGMPGGARPIA